MMIRLTKEQQQMMVQDIQQFFQNEFDQEYSEFDGQRVLDFVKESLAPHIYNAAITDVKYVFEQQFANFEEEIISLERPIRR